MNPVLTIAIPTVHSRYLQFNILHTYILNEIEKYRLKDKVEVIYEQDNKEISIGAKRQKLIDRANGEYLVMIDDDDWIADQYLIDVIEACRSGADTIGYLEDCSFDFAKWKTSCISMKWDRWDSHVGGYDYVRTPYFKNPIRTEICKKVGCADLRWGEDEDFAKKIKPLLKTEVFINKKMYIYRYKTEKFDTKYGFDKAKS